MEKSHFLSVEGRANRFDERYLFCYRPYIGGNDVIGFDIRGKKTWSPAFLNISFWGICIVGSWNLNVTQLPSPFKWSCNFLYLHFECSYEVFDMRSARVGLFCSSTDSSSFDRFERYEVFCMNSVANGEECSGWSGQSGVVERSDTDDWRPMEYLTQILLCFFWRVEGYSMNVVSLRCRCRRFSLNLNQIMDIFSEDVFVMVMSFIQRECLGLKLDSVD